MKYIFVIFIFILIWSIIFLYVLPKNNKSDMADIRPELFSYEYFTESEIVTTEPLYIPVEPVIWNNFEEPVKITVYDISSGETEETELEDYLYGVVFAEMPASFELEALKAQAVAARSYCIYKQLNGDSAHPEAAVCNDSSHCKAHLGYEDAAGKYGGDYLAPLWEKIRQAVDETRGEIIIYENEPAIAVFHAVSNESTESAADVWGTEVPYLTAVATPENDNNVKDFTDIKTFAYDEFKNILVSNNFRGTFESDPQKWIADITYNSASRVDTINICGINITGLRFRNLFSLRSASFNVEYSDGTFVITTKGYGHGVGLSQYGANLLALEGKDYAEILKWYYNGVEIAPITSPAR